MRRSGSLLALFAAVLFAGGCSPYAYDGVYPRPRVGARVAVVHDAGHQGDHYYRRVERDVERYVGHLDRYLHLTRRQQSRIRSVLSERVYDLLRHTHQQDYAFVYPFPRRHDARLDRRLERWWDRTDRRIESVLSRSQRRAYRDLVRGHHERYDQRRRDRRYDD